MAPRGGRGCVRGDMRRCLLCAVGVPGGLHDACGVREHLSSMGGCAYAQLPPIRCVPRACGRVARVARAAPSGLQRLGGPGRSFHTPGRSCVRYLKRTLFCIALTARPGTVSACVQSGSASPLAGASLPLVRCRASLRTPYSHRGGGGNRVGCGPPAPAGMYPPRRTAGRGRVWRGDGK